MCILPKFAVMKYYWKVFKDTSNNIIDENLLLEIT